MGHFSFHYWSQRLDKKSTRERRGVPETYLKLTNPSINTFTYLSCLSIYRDGR